MSVRSVVSCLLAVAVVPLAGCNIEIPFVEPLIGSGVPLTEERDVETFTKLNVSGALTVTASTDADQSVTVSGDDNIVPVIKTEVRDGTLHIYCEHQGSLRPKEPLSITIAASELKGANVSGACGVTVQGIEGASFDASLSGASTLTLSGECDQLSADVSGACNLKAASLTAKSARANVSGASNAYVHATESVSGDASGASTFRYSGSPTNTNVNASGASSAKAQ